MFGKRDRGFRIGRKGRWVVLTIGVDVLFGWFYFCVFEIGKGCIVFYFIKLDWVKKKIRDEGRWYWVLWILSIVLCVINIVRFNIFIFEDFVVLDFGEILFFGEKLF